MVLKSKVIKGSTIGCCRVRSQKKYVARRSWKLDVPKIMAHKKEVL
jgi:hypothetical protein